MKVFLTDQKHKFEVHLNSLKQKDIIAYDQNNLTEKTSTVEIITKKRLSELSCNFLFEYRIFPDKIIAALCEWTSENRKMQIGDTIVQQAYLPPLKSFSQKIIMGVRISSIINEPKRIGFSYETLEGHVEKGLSTFTLEEFEDGLIIFKIQTFSKPQNILAQLVGPIFSKPYQAFCTHQALKNAKKQLENLDKE